MTLLHVLHNVNRETAVSLLRAAGRAAAPAGRVAVLEIEGAHTLIGTLASLTFCAWMGARAFTADELRRMAEDAGLQDVRVVRPLRLPGSVLVHATP